MSNFADMSDNMTETPPVTWIIPAHNVGGMIGDAIESVLAQSETRWEMIVVDDGSTDDTSAVVTRYSLMDPRIHLVRREVASGGAYQPRKEGIMAARTPLVAPLDADDRVAPDYLERLLGRRAETDADIVWPMMSEWESGEALIDTPPELMSGCHSGAGLVRYTLDGWRISCNGGVLDRQLYMDAFGDWEPSESLICSDEYLTRLLLLRARRVALTDACYYYRVNPASVTHSGTRRLFDFMANNRRLVGLTASRFGTGSEEYRLAQRQNMHGVIDAMRRLNRLEFDAGAREYAARLVSEAVAVADHKVLKGDVSEVYRTLFRMPLPLALAGVRTLDMAIGAKKRLGTAVRGAGGERYRLVRHRLHRMARSAQVWRDTLALWRGARVADAKGYGIDRAVYHDGNRSDGVPGGVICVLDGSMYHGGLTDRMRGILTLWREVKRAGIREFHICWDSPFRLTDYLEPATFNWRTERCALDRSRSGSRIVVADDLDDTEALWRLRAGLRHSGRWGQIHVYTNADSARGEYAALYREIFRPVPALQEAVDFHRRILGEGYWTVTTRFQSLLGDFRDWSDARLDPAGQDALLARVTSAFKDIASRVPSGVRILVTSDSARFLSHISGVDPRVYVVPGGVANIDLDRGEAADAWFKTFVDQQLIMGASTVVRMTTGRMYPTGFPRFAAEVGGCEFIDCTF